MSAPTDETADAGAQDPIERPIDQPIGGSVDRPEAADAPADGGPSRPWRIALIALALVPILVAIVRAIRNDWFPIADSALLYIRARDVFTLDHHPFLGSWTSASLSVGENMNNPGPIYDDLLAPFSLVVRDNVGAAIGVGALNGLSIVGSVVAARHIGGWSLQRWVLLACAALSWSMGSEMLIDIWQAHALLLPFVMLLVLMLGITVGRYRCIPWALFVATILIQTHISYAYILAILVAAALVMIWDRCRPVAWGRWRAVLTSRTARWSVGVVAITWLQPIIEQLFGDGRGNLFRLASNSAGGDLQLGFRNSVRITARVLAQPPWQLRSGYADLIPSTPVTDTATGPALFVNGIPGVVASGLVLLVVFAVIVALGLAMRRLGRTVLSNMCALSAVLVVGAVVCLSILTVGRVGLAQHHVRWLWSVTVFLEMSVAASVVELIRVALQRRAASRPGATRSMARLSTGAVAAVLVLLVALNLPFIAQPQGPVADYAEMPVLRKVFPQLRSLANADPVVYDVSNVRVFEPFSSTVMLEMQRLGIEWRVTDEGMVRQLGNNRRADGTEPTTIFQLEDAAALTYAGPSCLVAIASLLDADGEEAAEQDARSITEQLLDGRILLPGITADDERQPMAAAIAAADVPAVQQMVLDGAVERWVLAETAVAAPGNEADLTAMVVRIGIWVRSTYALFADNPAVCING